MKGRVFATWCTSWFRPQPVPGHRVAGHAGHCVPVEARRQRTKLALVSTNVGPNSTKFDQALRKLDGRRPKLNQIWRTPAELGQVLAELDQGRSDYDRRVRTDFDKLRADRGKIRITDGHVFC